MNIIDRIKRLEDLILQLFRGGQSGKSYEILLNNISKNGEVIGTQDGHQVRLDLNVKRDEPGGISTYNGDGMRFYEKSSIDAMFANILALIQAIPGSQTLDNAPSLYEWWKVGQGITLVGGNVDTWTGIKGSVLAAPSATQRPTYYSSGGPNNTPYINVGYGQALTSFLASFPNTLDMLVVVVTRFNSNLNDINTVAQYGGGDWFWAKQKYGVVQMTNYDNINNYSEAEAAAVGGQWVKVEVNAYRSKTSGESGVKVGSTIGYMTLDNDNTAPFGPDFLGIGARDGSGALALNGDITDVLVFKSIPASGDVNLLNTTMSSKFGV